MTNETMDRDQLVIENAELQRRLDEAEETLRAIRSGEVDAVFVQGGREQVLTLETAEKPYQLLVEQMQHGAATLTNEGRVLYCNPRFATLLKQPVQELIGQSLHQFVAPGSQFHFENLLREAHEAGEVKAEVMLQRDNAPLPVYLSIECLEVGALGHCILVADLSEQLHYKELERTQAALRESEERLLQANAELEERVSKRTSELRRNAEQLRCLTAELARVEQKERRRLARVLHDHVQQLLVAARLRIEILSSQSPAESSQKTLTEVTDMLNAAIEAARSLSVELAPPLLHDQGLPAALGWLATRMSASHCLDVALQADVEANPVHEDQLDFFFHATRELLLNVMKHAKTDRVTVRLAREGRWNVLVVSDNGIGFDASAQNEDSFGLFHLRQRVEALGGGLTIQSKAGEGTRVAIALPADADPESNDLTSADNVRGSNSASDGNNVRVLVVDDHQMVREGLAQLLMLEPGFEVVGEAYDGPSGIEQSASLLPDVVLMDVSMPGMSGIDATRQISNRLPGVRVIGLSLHEEDKTAEAMLRAGAIGYVTKTRASKELVGVIRSLVVK